MDAVQHHAARAFEGVVRFELGEVHNFLHGEAVGVHQVVKDVFTTFLSAVGREHGVETHPSVAVKAHPVVGEQGVGRVGGWIVVHDNDVDTRTRRSSTMPSNSDKAMS